MPDVYVSFAGPEGFRGVVVVPVETCDCADDEAIDLINAAGINPGGEAVVFLVPPGTYPHFKLLIVADLIAIQGSATKLRDLTDDERELAEDNSVLICEHCCTRQPQKH